MIPHPNDVDFAHILWILLTFCGFYTHFVDLCNIFGFWSRCLIIKNKSKTSLGPLFVDQNSLN